MIETPHEPGSDQSSEVINTRALPNVWISAAVLCVPPTPKWDDRADWIPALGGSLHPVMPNIIADTFPCALSLAVHVRVQGSGDAKIQVSVADAEGAALVWGSGTNEAASREVNPRFFPLPRYAFIACRALQVVLPAIIFPAPGWFRMLVRLTSLGEERELQLIPLPLVVMPTKLKDPPPTEVSRSDLRHVVRELDTQLTPDARRVLRLAAAEARRFNRRSIDLPHLVIAVRRLLGQASGLPPVAALREAQERVSGLPMSRSAGGAMHLSPDAADFLRRLAHSSDVLGAPQLLQALLRADYSVEQLFSAVRSPTKPTQHS